MSVPSRTFAHAPIACAARRGLNGFVSGQPVVKEAILDTFRPIVIGVATTSIEGDANPRRSGRAKTFFRDVQTSGCFQAGPGEKLEVQAEGERSLQNALLHTTPDFNVPTDTLVKIDGTNYRVMAVRDYSVNGFVAYELTEDYERRGL